MYEVRTQNKTCVCNFVLESHTYLMLRQNVCVLCGSLSATLTESVICCDDCVRLHVAVIEEQVYVRVFFHDSIRKVGKLGQKDGFARTDQLITTALSHNLQIHTKHSPIQ